MTQQNHDSTIILDDNTEEPIVKENIFGGGSSTHKKTSKKTTTRAAPQPQPQPPNRHDYDDSFEFFLNDSSPSLTNDTSNLFQSSLLPSSSSKNYRDFSNNNQQHHKANASRNPFRAAEVVFDETTGHAIHIVHTSDTLEGLAIRYGVTANAIMKANKLFTRNAFQSRNTLVIPITRDGFFDYIKKTQKEQRDRAGERDKRAHQFSEVAGCDINLAKYYLEQTKYNFDRALDKYQIDIAATKERHVDNKDNQSNNNIEKDFVLLQLDDKDEKILNK